MNDDRRLDGSIVACGIAGRVAENSATATRAYLARLQSRKPWAGKTFVL